MTPVTRKVRVKVPATSANLGSGFDTVGLALDYHDELEFTLSADPVLSLTLPGKVQSYMAAGKPVIGAIDGETEAVIREAQCGYCGPAEDVEGLAENIKKFIGDADRRVMGANARAYYETHFARERFMDGLEDSLK